jgi:FkbM family methyltransferase
MNNKRNTLIYIGANAGCSLANYIDKFEKIYAFEPDPEMFKILTDKYSKINNVKLINAACSLEDGEADLYITLNRVSTSLADLSNAEKKLGSPEAIKIIKIKTINLNKFLKENNIEYIDYYLSDAQGSDLNILKTITEYIENKKNKRIIYRNSQQQN